MARGNVYDAEEIRRLSQEEGLNDRQISEIIKCSRATITKLRKRNNIPNCNIRNRKDKTFVCAICKKDISIRRNERRKAICDDCMESIINFK